MRSEHYGPAMFDGDEIVLGPLPKGIVRAGEGQHRRVWNVLGHTYWARAISESSFAFETLDPPGTGVGNWRLVRISVPGHGRDGRHPRPREPLPPHTAGGRRW